MRRRGLTGPATGLDRPTGAGGGPRWPYWARRKGKSGWIAPVEGLNMAGERPGRSRLGGRKAWKVLTAGLEGLAGTADDVKGQQRRGVGLASPTTAVGGCDG